LQSDDEGRLGIDELYRAVIKTATEDFSDQQIEECYSILKTIILLQAPLSLAALGCLLRFKERQIARLLTGFHSVLAIPRDGKSGVVKVIHISFRDFLTKETRCRNERLLIQPIPHHRRILSLLLTHISEGLTGSKSAEECLAYACQYWTNHLELAEQGTTNRHQLVEEVKKLGAMKALSWIETLTRLHNIHATEHALERCASSYFVSALILFCYGTLVDVNVFQPGGIQGMAKANEATFGSYFELPRTCARYQ
jgi:hypothetical protein